MIQKMLRFEWKFMSFWILFSSVSHLLTQSSSVQLFNLLVCLYTGSFHLIHLMFDDYVLYLLESLHCQERANDLMRAMKGEGSTGETAAWRSNPQFMSKLAMK